MRDDYPGTVPDYTRACIVMFGVNLSWILVAIWTVWGLIIAVVFSWVLHRAMDWIDRYRMVRRQKLIQRGK